MYSQKKYTSRYYQLFGSHRTSFAKFRARSRCVKLPPPFYLNKYLYIKVGRYQTTFLINNVWKINIRNVKNDRDMRQHNWCFPPYNAYWGILRHLVIWKKHINSMDWFSHFFNWRMFCTYWYYLLILKMRQMSRYIHCTLGFSKLHRPTPRPDRQR